MIREISSTVGNRVVGTLGRALGRTQERRPLPVDLLESDDEFLAIFDAPGAMSSDIQVKFEDGAILVKLDRFRDFRDGFEMLFPGRGLALNGRVELPENAAVDPSAATATLKENGTLHVAVPKIPEQSTESETVSVDTEATESHSSDT